MVCNKSILDNALYHSICKLLLLLLLLLLLPSSSAIEMSLGGSSPYALQTKQIKICIHKRIQKHSINNTKYSPRRIRTGVSLYPRPFCGNCIFDNSRKIKPKHLYIV
jgi:hypothetical protein